MGATAGAMCEYEQASRSQFKIILAFKLRASILDIKILDNIHVVESRFARLNKVAMHEANGSPGE